MQNSRIKDAMIMVLHLAWVLLIIDAIGFIAWAMSGQFPISNVYIGVITKSFLSLFI